MTLTILTLLLISNALTLRKDKSILFSRVVMVSLIHTSFLAYNNLFLISLDKGIGILGGLFHVTVFTQIFNIFIFSLSAIILTLTSFYPRKELVKKIFSLSFVIFWKFNYNKTKNTWTIRLLLILISITLMLNTTNIYTLIVILSLFIYSIVYTIKPKKDTKKKLEFFFKLKAFSLFIKNRENFIYLVGSAVLTSIIIFNLRSALHINLASNDIFLIIVSSILLFPYLALIQAAFYTMYKWYFWQARKSKLTFKQLIFNVFINRLRKNFKSKNLAKYLFLITIYKFAVLILLNNLAPEVSLDKSKNELKLSKSKPEYTCNKLTYYKPEQSNINKFSFKFNPSNLSLFEGLPSINEFLNSWDFSFKKRPFIEPSTKRVIRGVNCDDFPLLDKEAKFQNNWRIKNYPFDMILGKQKITYNEWNKFILDYNTELRKMQNINGWMKAKLKDSMSNIFGSYKIVEKMNIEDLIRDNYGNYLGLIKELEILDKALEYCTKNKSSKKEFFDLWGKRQVLYHLHMLDFKLNKETFKIETGPCYCQWNVPYPTIYIKNFFHPTQVYEEILENKLFVQLEIKQLEKIFIYFEKDFVQDVINYRHVYFPDELEEKYDKINKDLFDIRKMHINYYKNKYSVLRNYYASWVDDWSDIYLNQAYLNKLSVNKLLKEFRVHYEHKLPDIPLSTLVGSNNKYDFCFRYKKFLDINVANYFGGNYENSIHKIIYRANFSLLDEPKRLPYSHSVGINYAWNYCRLGLLSEESNTNALKYIRGCIFLNYRYTKPEIYYFEKYEDYIISKGGKKKSIIEQLSEDRFMV